MLLTALLALSLQAPPASLDDLIQRLSAELIETRAKALEVIKTRWESWTDADLAKLRKAAESKSADLAVNAKTALAYIDIRRKFKDIPSEVWTRFPELGALLEGGEPEPIGRLLLGLAACVEKGELTARAVLPAALEFIADDRDTKIGTGFFRMGEEHTYTVNGLASDILWRATPSLGRLDKVDEARAWWRANKGKTDREWHLDGLRHEDQVVRAISLVRLAELKDPTLQPKLLEALKGIDGDEAFRRARGAFVHLPPALVLPELERRLKGRGDDNRLMVLYAISEIQDPAAEELLVGAFDDAEQRFGAWYARISHPRVCDFAGLLLESRLNPGAEKPDWPESIRERDKKLEAIRNQWRKRKGLPPLPFLGPGVVAVGAEKVAELVLDLTHESVERRTAGLKRLSQLGPGAWKPLQDLIASATPPAKERLERAAADWSNALRVVTAENEAAAGYAKILEAGLHLPFDFETFHEKVLGAWYEDSGLIGLETEYMRGADGRGISLSIKVVKSKKPGVAPATLTIYGGGSGCTLNCKRKWFDDEMRKQFDDLLSAMKAGPDKQAGMRFQMRKAGPNGERLKDFDPDE